MVELNDLHKPELREVIISIRTFPSYAEWMKEKKVSPSRLFNKALEELMEKENIKINEKELKK